MTEIPPTTANEAERLFREELAAALENITVPKAKLALTAAAFLVIELSAEGITQGEVTKMVTNVVLAASFDDEAKPVLGALQHYLKLLFADTPFLTL